MATIKELVDKHSKVPGDIRVTHEDLTHGFWWRPYFSTFENSLRIWWVQSHDGTATSIVDGVRPWKLYIEPKPKVKRAQYLIEYMAPAVEYPPKVTPRLYVDEFEAMHDDPAPQQWERKCTRLVETEREFER